VTCHWPSSIGKITPPRVDGGAAGKTSMRQSAVKSAEIR
jgi:hypothetical protein